MMKNLARASVVLVAILALTGCVRAEGFTKDTERSYIIQCWRLGGEIREVSTPEVTVQCVFNFPDLPHSE